MRDAEFSADGQRVVTASEDGEAGVWNVPRDLRSLTELQRTCWLLAARRVDETGALAPIPSQDFVRLWSSP